MSEFTWLEALLTMAVMIPAGVLAAVATWKWIEHRNGEIERLESELVEKSRGLGVDPQDVVRTGLIFAAVGATERQINVYAKISARNVICHDDLNQLAEQGVRMPALEREEQ